jgi:hypothetical protein
MWKDDIRFEGVDKAWVVRFIETQIISNIIEDIFSKMPTAGESGETIYLDVKEVNEFKQQLRSNWLSGEKEGERL